MRWFVVWIAGAATTALGVLMLLAPAFMAPGKGGASGPQVPELGPQVPFALMLMGMVGTVVGVIGIWQSRVSRAVTQSGSIALRGSTISLKSGVADTASVAGPVLAVAAALALVSGFIGGPVDVSLGGSGPCGQLLTNNCILANSGFYSEVGTGFPVVVLALLLASAAALIGWLALVMDTGRRRAALSGLLIGSLTVVAMLAFFFLMVNFGGGD